MGQTMSTPLYQPPPPPMPTINSYPQGISVFKIPDNSGSIDIDVNNLQRCINSGGGASCITNYVQGYDVKDNLFVPSQITTQGFQLLENNNNNDNSKIVLGIIIAITLLILLLK